MKIYKIEVENYRLLKNFSLDIEDELSLIIGKNNSGKTSLLKVLQAFLSKGKSLHLSYDDLNIDFRGELISMVSDESTFISEEDYKEVGVKLRLYIKYDEVDNLSNVSQIMMDLEPDNNVVVLSLEYVLSYTRYLEIKKGCNNFRLNEEKKKAKKKAAKIDYTELTITDFLKARFSDYFSTYRKSIQYDHETKTIDQDSFINLDDIRFKLENLISFKFISAKRDVGNKEINNTLSYQTSRIYKGAETSEEQDEAVDDFKDTLIETDKHLSKIYNTLFERVIDKVSEFGGIKINESTVKIVSSLRHKTLLEGNTTVVYKHDEDNDLPESFNGLGYMNLISMIFELEILVDEFKKSPNERPADINLLFIEEPEAHTHPQMQYVFIKNIKKLLQAGIKREDGIEADLQYLISSHSSHIVADSDFDDIKYLRRTGSNSVESRNVKELKQQYHDDPKAYEFLKQYLTISRAEAFFADKMILIEGDTERILFPTIMQKIDNEQQKEAVGENPIAELPLLSQNISIIEVGAYCQIFEKFIDFIGAKSLLLTDIDSVRPKVGEDPVKMEACKVADGEQSSNSALSHFLDSKTWAELKVLAENDRTVEGANTTILIAYQQEEANYHARSFEDAFIHINNTFIKDNINNFTGLQNKKLFTSLEDKEPLDAYDLAEKCVKKKTHFALDIIYNGNKEMDNWAIPTYIKQGLLWLQKD